MLEPSGRAKALMLWKLFLWLLLAIPSYADTSSEVLKRQTSEDAVQALIEANPAVVASWSSDDVVMFISRGWWAAARAFITQSHEVSSQSQTAALATTVRREVNTMKQNADALLLALSTQDREKLSIVQCSFQWAQNSSVVFLSVKFSHRWSSPGALKVADEQLDVTPCCFNFTAVGEHSQLHKKYGLNIHFYKPVDPSRWTWEFASAGRMTVEIRKAEPSSWPRLHYDKKWPKNMATWDSMESRWSAEMREFERSESRKKRKATGNDSDVDPDIQEEDMLAAHRNLEAKCTVVASSLFKGERKVKNLCESYWPPKMTGKMGRDALWLVLFFSAQDMSCHERSSKCTSVREQWNTVASRMWDTKGIYAGVVDCDLNKDFCEKQELGHLPTIRRHKAGKRKTFYGEWEIDSLMKFVD